MASNQDASEMDTNNLFERYTIDEIREIEKKTRTNIERKKEDLRTMVGERYRDLIEAADTITEMKHSAENVKKSIAHMQDMCQNLKQIHMVKGNSSRTKKETQRKKDESQFYGIATQIKLLLDMPEKMWTALDKQSYLYATQLYLLARHINTGLQLDSQQASKILNWFPVLTRQWAAISHFKNTILQASRDTLKEPNVSDQIIAECLCSILLLEDSTPRQIFNEFLLARTSSVQQLFQTDHSHPTVKSQVCAVVEMIVLTIHQIHAIFYENENRAADDDLPSNLLLKILSGVTNQEGVIMKNMGNTAAIRHLPKSVVDFRPRLVHHANTISENNLQSNCQQWIDICKQDVTNGLTRLLGFITTVKGIAAIRDEVWQLLNEDVKMATWEKVCSRVLKQTLPVWEEFFQQHFISRTKALLDAQFDAASSASKQQIGKVLGDLGTRNDKIFNVERDLSSYIWIEGANDIPAQTAWGSGITKTLVDGGALMMKARAFTPAVQGLCQSFDEKLKTLLEDATYYLKSEEDEKKDAGSFDKFADNDSILLYIQTAANTLVQKLIDHMNQQVYVSKQQLSNRQDMQGSSVIINHVILMGRLCGAIPELCPCLQQCINGYQDKKESTRALRRSSSILKSHSKKTDHPKWIDMKQNLNSFRHNALNIWSEYTCDVLIKQFTDAVCDASGPAVIRAATRWDEIEIQEETEDGKSMKSTIKVPMQASWFVQSLLYTICQEINRVGGHAIDRSTLQLVVGKLSNGVIEAIEKSIANDDRKPPVDGEAVPVPLTQTRVLQILFDLKFFTAILPRKDDTEDSKRFNSRVLKLIDELESKVDPFDLDVFSPYIQTHLQKQARRSNILYGALTSLDKHASYQSSRPTQTGHQEQHNVLPLSNCQTRFQLLPLSIQSRTGMPPPIVQPPKPKMAQVVTGPVSPPPVIHPEGQSSSFFGNMSTIWFSNVAGGKP